MIGMGFVRDLLTNPSRSSKKGTTLPDLNDVVADINRTHGFAFRVEYRFDSGMQQGAWRLRGSDCRRAVLKFSRDRSVEDLRRLPDAIDLLRKNDYPTPAWFAVGVAEFPYYVQEFLDGIPSTPLTAAKIPLLLDILERQAGLNPAPHIDANAGIRRTIVDGPDRTVRALGAQGERLVDDLVRLLDRHGPIDLPGGDLVHGDFNSCNILLDRGTVAGIIDIEAMGSGTRVIDYACLLREAYVEDYGPAVTDAIRAAAEPIAGPAALALCVAATAYDIVQFKRQHQPERLDHTITRLRDLARDLTP